MARNELERTITATATIQGGASLSDVADLGPGRLVGLVMPAAWTAADLTFQVSADGSNFVNLNSTGSTNFALQVAAGHAYAVELNAAMVSGFAVGNPFAGYRYVKVRSGTSAIPVNQAAERQITVIARF